MSSSTGSRLSTAGWVKGTPSSLWGVLCRTQGPRGLEDGAGSVDRPFCSLWD